MFGFVTTWKFFLSNLIFITICATSVLCIVNGDFASIEQNPWQVSLNAPRFYWWSTHICGGVIIGERWILTADHCFDKNPDLFVRAGTNKSTAQGSVVYIKEVHHYNAHESNDYVMDFAIIELDSELKFSDTINKIKIPDENYDLTGIYAAIATGYGRIGYEEEDSKYLKIAELSVIMTDECNFERRTSKRICARDVLEKATGTKINAILLSILKLLVCLFFSL